MSWRSSSTIAAPEEACANRRKVDTVLGCIRSLDWTPKDFIENLLCLQEDAQLTKDLETTARTTISMLTNSIQDVQLMRTVSQHLPNHSWRRQCYHVMGPHLCCVPIGSCVAPGGKRKAEVAGPFWHGDEHTSKYIKTSSPRPQTGSWRPAQMVSPKLSFQATSQAFTAVNQDDEARGGNSEDMEEVLESASSDACALCGQPGHDLEACTSPLFGGGPATELSRPSSADEGEGYEYDDRDEDRDEEKDQCYRCGNHGHSSQRCPHPEPGAGKKRDRRAETTGPRRWIAWTPDEDARLPKFKIQNTGRMKYRALMEEFPGRTTEALRVRVRYLEGKRQRT